MHYMTEPDRADTIDPPATDDHGGDEDAHNHITEGRWNALLAFLGRHVPRFPLAPRALCGRRMWADPDRPGPRPWPLSPFCPECLAITGETPETIAATTTYVPGHWA